MFDYPGRLIAGILAIIMITFFPLQYIAQSNSESIDTLVDEKTQALSDSIRDKGYLDVLMYEEYINFLDTTGELYDVELEDIHPVTGEEIPLVSNEGNIFSLACEDSSHDHGVASYLYKQDDSHGKFVPLAVKSDNKSDMLYASLDYENVIKSFAAHTHTDDCYAGHRHTAACGASMPITFSITRNADSSGSTTSVSIHCGYCQKTIYSATIEELNMRTNVIIYKPKYIVFNKYEDFNAYWAAKNQVEQLIRNLNPYITYNESGGGYGSSSYEKNGYVPGKNFTFELPYTKKIDNCTSCNGDPLIFEVSGGYNSYYSHYEYSLTCNYCSKLVVGTTFRSYSHYDAGPFWSVDIYGNNGLISATYSGKSFQPFCDLIRSHAHDSNGKLINFFIALDDPILQFDFLDEAINHGCSYPAPPCKLEEDITPICNRVVTSITATNPIQTVKFGGAITTTATATYLDGHTATVNCTSNYNPNISGIQTVTLTYSGLVGNAKTYGTRTCVIKVTVRENNIPSYLTIKPSAYTVYNGSEPSYIVTLVYRNGVSKVITGYTKSGWTSGPGTKTVTFTYTENGITVSRSVDLVVKPNLLYIGATPYTQTVERYSVIPPFTVTGFYEDGSNHTVNEYTVYGLNTSLIGLQPVTISYSENRIARNVSVSVNVIPIQKICKQCGARYSLDNNDIDNGCPICKSIIMWIEVEPVSIITEKGTPLNVIVTAYYKDGHSSKINGWTSNYDMNRIGMQLVTVEYGGFAAEVTVWVEEQKIICPICGTHYPNTEPRCPICSENVVSISADPGTITVIQNDNIILTVTAYFADGSRRIINDWSIDRTSAASGTYQATVSYRSASTTITLIIIPETATQCPICGIIYEPSEHSSGCPVCSRTITDIEAYLTSGSNRVQYGAVPSIAVIIIFKDTHREITTEGYLIENYNPTLLGTQVITIRYNEYSTTIEIEVIDTLGSVTCPNGHVYYLNEDGTDPGCPYCSMGEALGTVYYYDINYIADILETVYSNGIYYFDEGNYITLIVSKKNISIFSNIQNTFFKTSMLGRVKKYTYGGGVY